MEAERIAKEKWNSESDEYNQWDALGQDEKDVLIKDVLLNQFIDCYFERGGHSIKQVVEDAIMIMRP
jgi:hypothetical protein